MDNNKHFFNDYQNYILSLLQSSINNNNNDNFNNSDSNKITKDIIYGILIKYSENEELKENYFENFPEKNIFMIGSPGSGKSTITNVLYNGNVNYQSLYIPNPALPGYDHITTDVYGQRSQKTNLFITDTPGLNKLNKDYLRKTVYDITNSLLNGIDYLLIVIRKERISIDLINTLSFIDKIFSNLSESTPNIIFITTYCDDDDPKIYDKYQKDKTSLSEFLKETNLIDNNQKLILQNFLNKSLYFLELSFASDLRDKHDVLKKETRLKSLELLKGIIYQPNNRYQPKLSQNYIDILYNATKFFFNKITEKELVGFLQVMHEKYRELLITRTKGNLTGFGNSLLSLVENTGDNLSNLIQDVLPMGFDIFLEGIKRKYLTG